MKKELILAIAVCLATASYGKSSSVDAKSSTPKNPTFVSQADPMAADASYKGMKWRLVENLSDEFNGDKLDGNKWCADPEGNGWRWLGRAPQLFMEKSVSVKDGTMQILGGVLDKPIEKTSYKKTHTYKYHSGIVRTYETGKVGYYFECRMKMNKSELGGGFWVNVNKEVDGSRHEIDIQECVGCTTELTEKWGRTWDHIVHSNAIDWKAPKDAPQKRQRDQAMKLLDTKNHENYHIHGAWWKSPNEILIFLDGKYLYTLKPPVPFTAPGNVQISIEMYDWNPIPEDGGKVASLPEADRTSHFDWVRVWEVK